MNSAYVTVEGDDDKQNSNNRITIQKKLLLYAIQIVLLECFQIKVQEAAVISMESKQSKR